MDFGLLFNLCLGTLAVLRCVLFVVFYRSFRESDKVHPIYRQACSPAPDSEEPLPLTGSVESAA